MIHGSSSCPRCCATFHAALDERPAWIERVRQVDAPKQTPWSSHVQNVDDVGSKSECAQVSAQISLRCPRCKGQLAFCEICEKPLPVPVETEGPSKCKTCGYPVHFPTDTGITAAPQRLSAEQVRRIQLSLCGRRSYYATKQVELGRLSQAYAELRAPATTPLLLGPPLGDGLSLGDIKTPDFKSYLAPHPAELGDGATVFPLHRKRKDGSLSGALNDSNKSATPSSDEKRSTSSDIRGRGAPTPITSVSASGRLSHPPIKRRKLELQPPPCTVALQGGHGEEQPLGPGSGISLSFRSGKSGHPFQETNVAAATGNTLRATEGVGNEGVLGVGSSSQDLEHHTPPDAAEDRVGQEKGLEELSSGGHSRVNARVGDDSGSGQHASQEPNIERSRPADAVKMARREEYVGKPKSRAEAGVASGSEDPSLEKQGKGEAPRCACTCREGSEAACRPCRLREVEAALVLCRYQLLCLKCPATEAQERDAQARPAFDLADLALLRARLGALATGGDSEQGGCCKAVLEGAERFLEQRPGLLHLREFSQAAGKASRRSCADLGAFSQQYPSRPLAGLRALKSLLDERSTDAHARARAATSPFRGLLVTISDQVEALRRSGAAVGQSGSTGASETIGRSVFADLQAVVREREAVKTLQEGELRERRRLKEICGDLRELYRTIWSTVGGL
ncbi:hypothetical protein KFL_003920150 [Klebsormidium nitens]|uniref:Uncharacterized protein n=1 Tax=Klebsormidium nitens TaxID=105231 RepID=A0A1Y1IAK5_KLENI|nr:hypothetical protein KFL_003920150 [Klebsormidium nitens]|eukprot:GAQ87995.1 hypothetical protein KFL_003920150 [Klebsormidium nitens]